MKKIPTIIEPEFGKVTLTMYRKLERTELRICNFKNHQRFSLRCLSKGVIPVSLNVKNNIRTHKNDCIIYKVEKELLNERIKNINNTIECFEHEKYMYENKLNSILGPEM